uniref:Ras-related protein Rab-24-like n=1 Tax=Hirondellea gigas TaxID=1518452 RepID=A0A6A7G7T8_9CRUS
MSGDGSALKIVLLGMKNVGKTSLFNRYVYDEFGQTSMTIGAYFATKQCEVNNQSYNLAIWDTAGEEKFDSLTSFYCRGARAAVVCYDLTNRASFDNLERWCQKITEAGSQCSLIFAGNKLDLVEEDSSRRAVEQSQVEQFAATKDALVAEVSAKSGTNVAELFEKVVAHYLEGNHPKEPEGKRNVKMKPANQETSCC